MLGADLESRTSTAAYGGLAGAHFTPLMMAAKHGHGHVVDTLLSHGALIGPVAADGATDAIALACRSVHKTVVGVLLDHAVVAVPADCNLPAKKRGELGMHGMLREMHRLDASSEREERGVGGATVAVAAGEQQQHQQGMGAWDLPAFSRFLALRPHQSSSSGSPQLLFNSLDSDRSGILETAEWKALPHYLGGEL